MLQRIKVRGGVGIYQLVAPVNQEESVVKVLLRSALFAAMSAWLGLITVATQPQGHRHLPLLKLTKSVMFDTPEAARLLATSQVFPLDNSWNQDVSGRKAQ